MAKQSFVEHSHAYVAPVPPAEDFWHKAKKGNTMKYGELTLGQIEALVNKLGGVESVYALLRGEHLVTTKVRTHYRLSIDYKRTLSDMIFCGHYDVVDSTITRECFPMKSYGHELHAELIHFDRSISSSDAVAALKLYSLRPATLAELLAFGERHPFEQLKFSIVALGFPAEEYYSTGVPFLGSTDTLRLLSLDHSVCNWSRHDRFLAVRDGIQS